VGGFAGQCDVSTTWEKIDPTDKYQGDTTRGKLLALASLYGRNQAVSKLWDMRGLEDGILADGRRQG
jgi:hypothetical protein